MAGISDFNPAPSGKAWLGLLVTVMLAGVVAGLIHGLVRKI